MPWYKAWREMLQSVWLENRAERLAEDCTDDWPADCDLDVLRGRQDEDRQGEYS